MPLRDDVLIPVPGANPAGENLRYAPVYDKIKEARREDDDAPQGDWRRERKLADWPLTVKLTAEALTKKSKDLQLAAWLTEALVRRNGMSGLLEGLQVLHGLVEAFWDSLYPEIEDGDAEFRAAPLQWVGEKLENAVKSTPLTRGGLDFYKYRESRAVGYEQDAAENDSKAAARAEAIAEGKVTAEQFDESFQASPKAWYAQLVAACDEVTECIAALTELCDQKFGDVSPSFGRLQSTVDEVRQSAHILLQKKRETEPDPVEAAPPADEPQPEPAPTVSTSPAPASPARSFAASAAGAAAAPARAPRSLAGEPGDYENAVESVAASARFLRRQQPGNPGPYLMLRGLRWGELRSGANGLNPELLDAPPTEMRQQLKRLYLQSAWKELLEAAEDAMGCSYGRGWLDIQRYTCQACAGLGNAFASIGDAVIGELLTLLRELPDLPQATLMDDTASASPDTLAWLAELGALPAAGAMPRPARPARTVPEPDAFERAQQAVAEGRQQEGLEILSRQLGRERSGRDRFQRKVQLAQLCLSIGRDAIAFPLLHDLAAEIEARKLEEWETSESVAHPLSLLYRCLDKMEADSSERHKLYERICRLDPAQAMSCTA